MRLEWYETWEKKSEHKYVYLTWRKEYNSTMWCDENMNLWNDDEVKQENANRVIFFTMMKRRAVTFSCYFGQSGWLSR